MSRFLKKKLRTFPCIKKFTASFCIVHPKLEIIKFVNSSQLDVKQEFVLRDVPYYRNLEDSIRVRLARSINKLICNPSTDTSLSSVIERSYRKDGTPKLRYGAAVYTKK